MRDQTHSRLDDPQVVIHAVNCKSRLAVGLDGDVANNARVPDRDLISGPPGKGNDRGEGDDGRVRLDCLEVALGSGATGELLRKQESRWTVVYRDGTITIWRLEGASKNVVIRKVWDTKRDRTAAFDVYGTIVR